jgi:hypothetical protein
MLRPWILTFSGRLSVCRLIDPRIFNLRADESKFRHLKYRSILSPNVDVQSLMHYAGSSAIDILQGVLDSARSGILESCN